MKDDQEKAPKAPQLSDPESDGCGAAKHRRTLLKYAMDLTLESAEEIRLTMSKGGGLSRAELARICRKFRSGLTDRKRAGRRPSKDITAAYEDWLAGMRGKELYSKHVTNYAALSHWRKRDLSEKLMSALRSRKRRKKRASGSDSQPLLESELREMGTPF